MPRRSQTNFAVIAFLVSLLIHAVLIAALVDYAQRFPVGSGYAASSRRASPDVPLTIEAEHTLPEFIPPPIEQQPRWGQANGSGDAATNNNADGVQKAPQSRIDQAGVTRDPEGLTGAIESAQPAVEALASTSEPRAFRPMTQERMLKEAPIGQKARTAPEPVMGKDQQTQKEQIAQAEQKSDAPPKPNEQPRKAQSGPSQADPGRPLEHSDRDSDLFASEVAVRYERGRVQARQGREFKLARLQPNLSSYTQAYTISFPAIIRMQIEIDADGKVKRVTVLRSTGSGSIDREIELAMYSSWFEPENDRSTGKPKARDSFEFAISID